MDRVAVRPEVLTIEGEAGSTDLAIGPVSVTVDDGGADVVVVLVMGDDLVVLVVTHGRRFLVSRLESLVPRLIGSRRLSCGLGTVGGLLRRGAAGRSGSEPAAGTVDGDGAGVGRVAAPRRRGLVTVSPGGPADGRPRSIALATGSRTAYGFPAYGLPSFGMGASGAATRPVSPTMR